LPDLFAHPGDVGLECVPGEDGARVVAVVWQRVALGLEQHLGAAVAQEPEASGERRVVGEVGVGLGTMVIGRAAPSVSLSGPRARVSDMPAASLLSVLKVRGATVRASGGGRTSGSSGRS
jgi:hypothetical protein